jgi:hypothetical protein
MSEEQENHQKSQEETQDTLTKKAFSESRGHYMIAHGKKIFNFDFPISTTIEENLNIVTFLKKEILKTIEMQELEEIKRKSKNCEKDCKK